MEFKGLKTGLIPNLTKNTTQKPICHKKVLANVLTYIIKQKKAHLRAKMKILLFYFLSCICSRCFPINHFSPTTSKPNLS